MTCATVVNTKRIWSMSGEVKPINWSCISAKEQNHQMCRYCFARATHMRKQTVGRNKLWVALCAAHAGQDKGSEDAKD